MKYLLNHICHLIGYIGAIILFFLGFRGRVRREAVDAGVSDYSGEGRDRYGDLAVCSSRNNTSKRKTHTVKILPEYYEAVSSGKKLFEVRKNDRGYNAGDFILLRDYDPEEGFSGRALLCRITYILSDESYCKEGYSILGIKVIRRSTKQKRGSNETYPGNAVCRTDDPRPGI